MSRRGIISLGNETLASLMCLPAGWIIADISGDFQRPAVLLQVTSPDLGDAPEGVPAPTVDGVAEEAWLVDDAGNLWARWGWFPKTEPLTLTCAVGQDAQCRDSAAGAIATWVRPRWDSRHAMPGVALLCERHFTTPPAEWNAAPRPAPPAGPDVREES